MAAWQPLPGKEEISPKEGKTPCMKLPPQTPLPSPSLSSGWTRMVAEGLKLGSSALVWLPTCVGMPGTLGSNGEAAREAHISPSLPSRAILDLECISLKRCFAIFLVATYDLATKTSSQGSPSGSDQGRGWLGWLEGQRSPWMEGSSPLLREGGRDRPPGEAWLWSLSLPPTPGRLADSSS